MSHRWWYRNLVDSSCTTQRVTLHVRGTRQEFDTCQGQLDTVQSSKMFRAYRIYINECQHISMQQTHFLGRNRRSHHAMPIADFMLWGSVFLFLCGCSFEVKVHSSTQTCAWRNVHSFTWWFGLVVPTSLVSPEQQIEDLCPVIKDLMLGDKLFSTFTFCADLFHGASVNQLWKAIMGPGPANIL